MAKGKSQQVFIGKKELLLPKMEFLSLNDKGQGFNIRELSAKSVLEYKELIAKIEAENSDKPLNDLQSFDLMATLVFMGACNADGTPYFADMDEATSFAGMSLTQLEMVADKVMQVSGLGATQNLKNENDSSTTS